VYMCIHICMCTYMNIFIYVCIQKFIYLHTYPLIWIWQLETLVLCVFNLFHRELQTPLDVLAKFLDYFAHFDWSSWSLTIRGPVPNSHILDGGEVVHVWTCVNVHMCILIHVL